jgi:hypothetical protein
MAADNTIMAADNRKNHPILMGVAGVNATKTQAVNVAQLSS